jgi:recombination protein RecT
MSILRGLMMAAEVGLEVGSMLGEAYLVPYENRKVRPSQMEAQFIPGYRGLITLARRTGEIANLYAEAVYPGDKFKVTLGLDPDILHEPDWESEERDNERNLIGIYAVAKFKDGSHQFTYLPKKKIERIRARSKCSDNGPWSTDYEEMCKKTGIRRLAKVLPMSVEMMKAVKLQEAAESGDFTILQDGPDGVIEVPPELGSDGEVLEGDVQPSLARSGPVDPVATRLAEKKAERMIKTTSSLVSNGFLKMAWKVPSEPPPRWSLPPSAHGHWPHPH